MPSSRSRPFALTFHPNGRDDQGGSSSSTSSPWPKSRVIPVNSFAPYQIENDHFKGQILLIHDTGNEVGLETSAEDEELDAPRKGVRLQIQGRFKRASTKGAANAAGLYVGGQMEAPLKLGWLTQKVINACAAYARKKTEGRMHIVLGDKDGRDLPHMAFPIAQLFTVVVTPPNEEPPKLGSPELAEVPWQGAEKPLDVDTVNTYTMCYKTPFLDCCSWELLNVPGISPLPLERLLGDIISTRVLLYDLGISGSHANWRKGCMLEWYFTRRAPGSPWLEQEELDDYEQTPLAGADEASDPSDASEASGVDDLMDGDPGPDDAASSSDSSTSEEEPVDEDEDAISRAESQCLSELASWRPRPASLIKPESDLSISIPYYIETVDRRRKRRLRVWYVFQLKDPTEKGEWWTAKAIHELRSACRKPRPRLRAFRRRRGATRGCQCYGVQTLEYFRQVVCTHLIGNTKLKQNVIAAAKMDINAPEHEPLSPYIRPAPTPTDATSVTVTSKDERSLALTSKAPTLTTETSGEGMTSPSMPSSSGDKLMPDRPETPGSGDAKARPLGAMKNRAEGLKRNAAEILSSSAAENAERIKVKAEAYKMKADVAKEKIKSKVKSKIKRSRGPLLPPPFFVDTGSSACDLAFASAKEGRSGLCHEAMVGSIHYEGRLCEEWMRLSNDGILRCFMPYDCERPRLRLRLDQILKVCRREGDGLFLGRFYLWEVHTVMRVMVFCSAGEEDAKEWVRAISSSIGKAKPPVRAPWPVKDSADLLTDLTRARRWRPVKRIVLNDRLLLNVHEASRVAPVDSAVAENLLQSVVSFKAAPALDDSVAFLNETCMLKAVNFESWSQFDLLAFWINVYHCLLLHGRLVLGTPKSRGELARFYSRVSYLVGTKPLSLKEIERYLLRVPIADRVAVTTSGRARGRQFMRLCCLCARRNEKDDHDSSSPNTSPTERRSPARSPPAHASPRTPESPRGSRERSPHGSEEEPQVIGKTKQGLARKCMPAPQVKGGFEKVAQRMVLIQTNFRRRGTSACFYMGGPPPALGVPEQDLKVAFVLNRGNLSCLPSIPLFNSVHVMEQMEEVCRRFVADFVRVSWKDNIPTRVTLPQCCRGLKRELTNDMQALLMLVWQFMPKDYPKPTKKTQVRFLKYQSEPRDIKNLDRFAYSRPEIRVSAARGQGPEFKVVAGAARELADIATKIDQIREASYSGVGASPRVEGDASVDLEGQYKIRNVADDTDNDLYWPDGTLRYTSL